MSLSPLEVSGDESSGVLLSFRAVPSLIGVTSEPFSTGEGVLRFCEAFDTKSSSSDSSESETS